MHFGGFLLNRCAAELPTVPTRWPELPVSDSEAWQTALHDLWLDQHNRHQEHRQAARALSQAAESAPVWMVPDVRLRTQAPIHFLAQLAQHLPPHVPGLQDSKSRR